MPVPVVELSASGRPVRKKRLTWKLLQQLPVAPTPLPDPPVAMELDGNNVPSNAETVVPTTIATKPNLFGLYHQYPGAPTHNPDSTFRLEDLNDSSAPKAYPSD